MEIIIDKDNRKHLALFEIIAQNLSFDKDFAGKPVEENISFTESDLNKSFLVHGIVNPLFIWQDQQKDRFVLIDGHKRWELIQYYQKKGIDVSFVFRMFYFKNKEEALEFRKSLLKF